MIKKEFGKHSGSLSPKIKPPYNNLQSKYRWGRWVGLQHVWIAPKKQMKNGAKTVEINLVGSGPKPPPLKGGKSGTSCRETASLLFRYVPLHSAGENLEILHESSVARFPANIFARAHDDY